MAMQQEQQDARMAGAVRKDSRYAQSRYSQGIYNQRPAAQQERRRFEQTEAELKKLFNQDPKLRPYKDNLKIEQIGAGMRIQLLDDHKTAMFPLGSAEMMNETNEVMAKIAESLKKLPNKIAIVGHTDATPYRADSGYSNWELSTDRAHASRRALIAAGLPEERLANVTGKAATDPLNKADPESPTNRRISILLLREEQPVEPQPPAPNPYSRRDNPYSNYRAPTTSPRQAPALTPALTPTLPQAPAPAEEAEEADPLEAAEDHEQAAEETAAEPEATPAEEPAEEAQPAEAKAEEAATDATKAESSGSENAEATEPEAEAPTVGEDFKPVPVERELIDSDLFQRL